MVGILISTTGNWSLLAFLAQTFPKFNGEISLGNIVTAAAFLLAAAFAWRDLNWRVNNIEIWKESHLHTTEQAVQNISMLRESIAKLTEIANGQERRLEMLEDHQSFFRGRQQ